MKHLVFGLNLIISRKDSRLVIIVSTLVFLLLLIITQNGKNALQVFSFENISTTKQITLFLSTLFDIRNNFTGGSIILATLGSLLGGINLSLAYTYMRIRGEIIFHSGLYHGLGMFLAFLGVGCAACGTAFLSVILSFFGFSAMLELLPYQGQEVGYIGLIFLCMATYALSKKVSVPNVC